MENYYLNDAIKVHVKVTYQGKQFWSFEKHPEINRELYPSKEKFSEIYRKYAAIAEKDGKHYLIQFTENSRYVTDESDNVLEKFSLL